MNTPNFFPIPAGLTRELFPGPARPKQGPDPRMQAFLEDLVAVCAKHQLQIYAIDHGVLFEGLGSSRFAEITAEGELLFGEDDSETWDSMAVAPIPTTAHGRLAAASRVEAIRAEQEDGWNTDVAEMAQAVATFEAALPGWWWSVGMCSVGAHASCAVDGNGPAAHLLDGVQGGHPYDAGFHCDTQGGAPHEALADVMQQALAYIKQQETSDA